METQTRNIIEKYFGKITKYHIYMYSLMFLCRVPITWHVQSLLFLSPPMNFNCKTTKEIDQREDVPDNLNRCPCEEPIWNTTVFTSTMQTKFGIYCQNNWLTSFSESLFYVGMVIGAPLFGFLSDKFGRLHGFSISCFIMFIAGTFASTMPHIAGFILMRFIEGIGCGGAIVTSYVLCIEFCAAKHRETLTALFHIPINIGHVTLAGLSYLLRDFDKLQLAISGSSSFMFFAKWLLVESPKWMVDHRDVAGTACAMEKICFFNKVSIDNIKADIEAHIAESDINRNQTPPMNFWEIFKHRQLTINLFCMSVIFFVCGLGYYGVSQFIGKMSGNIHLNVAISGCLLLPVTVGSIFLLEFFSRRTLLIVAFSFSGLCIVIVTCVPPDMTLLRVIVACLCDSFFFLTFIVVFLYGCELFPTAIRNSALGYLTLLSRIGQILAPPLNTSSEFASGAVYSVLALAGAIMCYPLPETKNQELP